VGDAFRLVISLVFAGFLKNWQGEFGRPCASNTPNARRPKMVGAAIKQVSAAPEAAQSLFGILQINSIAAGKAEVTVTPSQSNLLAELMAVGPS
jgi:hypothetical protein